MSKMHLTARPGNEGARRLAWWIGTMGAREAASRLERLAGVDAPMCARLLAGEVIPASETGHLIWLMTDGRIRTDAWRQAPRGGWFDRPAGFQEQEARGGLTPATARAGGVTLPLGASPAPVQAACA